MTDLEKQNQSILDECWIDFNAHGSKQDLIYHEKTKGCVHYLNANYILDITESHIEAKNVVIDELRKQNQTLSAQLEIESTRADNAESQYIENIKVTVKLYAQLAIAREALDKIFTEYCEDPYDDHYNPHINPAYNVSKDAIEQLDCEPHAVVEVGCYQDKNGKWYADDSHGGNPDGTLIVWKKEE